MEDSGGKRLLGESGGEGLDNLIYFAIRNIIM